MNHIRLCRTRSSMCQCLFGIQQAAVSKTSADGAPASPVRNSDASRGQSPVRTPAKTKAGEDVPRGPGSDVKRAKPIDLTDDTFALDLAAGSSTPPPAPVPKKTIKLKLASDAPVPAPAPPPVMH